MKNLSILLLLVICVCGASPIALAKKKQRLLFQHVATMTYHDPKVRNLLDGRTDLYFAGDYTCTPGDEHHAPDCRLSEDWFYTEAVSYIEIALDNGDKIVVTESTCDLRFQDCTKLEPWDHDKVGTVLRRTWQDIQNPVRAFAQKWELGNVGNTALPFEDWEPLKDNAKKTFHYELVGGSIIISPSDAIGASSR